MSHWISNCVTKHKRKDVVCEYALNAYIANCQKIVWGAFVTIYMNKVLHPLILNVSCPKDHNVLYLLMHKYCIKKMIQHFIVCK